MIERRAFATLAAADHHRPRRARRRVQDTVSRVLNGSPLVHVSTRDRVLAAVSDLGFQVNHAARSLRTSRTGPDRLPGPRHQHLRPDRRGARRGLADDGFSILLTSSRRRDPERDRENIEVLAGRGVDALVLAPSNDQSPELAAFLATIRTPIVLLDRELPGLTADKLLVDHAPGIRGALESLLASGRTRIGLLTRDRQTRAGRAIIEAWEEETARLGARSGPGLVAAFDDLDRRAGRDGVDRLLEAGVDAIVSTGTMEHTASVLGRLGERSVRVPNDVSLVVYGYLVPPMREHLGLPTIAYPVEEVATAVRQLLLRRLDQPEAAPSTSSVPTIFVDTAGHE